ncbi:MAG TPA: hypothetical protein VFC78_23830 [Tepidisphaeraceae bacterium]|nr:hypothetical protein [Tepidisphaeraceae bacterium]
MKAAPSILERVIKPREGDFSEEHARYVLSLHFSPEDLARYELLAAKAQEGDLTDAEAAELDEFLEVNTLLIVLKSKARISLRTLHSVA